MASTVASIELHDSEGSPLAINNLDEPLELSFKKTTSISKSVRALYWDKTVEKWSTNGV